MFDASGELRSLGDFECRLLAMLLLEQLLPELEAITPLRRTGPDASLRAELGPVIERQWAELCGASALDADSAERDARAVMSAIMENNTYLSEASSGDPRASNVDAALQALLAVVERSRTHRRSDGALIRHPFGARAAREVLVQFERLEPEAGASSTSLARLFERVRALAGDAGRAVSLRAEVRAELERSSRN